MEIDGSKPEVPPQVLSRVPVKIISRDEWSAQPPKETTPLDLPANKIFLIATDRPGCYSQDSCTKEIQRMQSFHMKIPRIPDIRYNFVISCNGLVYEGRGWKTKPNLPLLYDVAGNKSLFVALTGTFDDPKVAVPPVMLDTLDLLIQLGLDYKYIDSDYDTFDL